MVIWHLIDAKPDKDLTSAEQELFDDVLLYENDFVPDFYAREVFCVIVDTTILSNDELYIGQTLLLEHEVECVPIYNQETDWAIAVSGQECSKSRSWGSYFLYTK